MSFSILGAKVVRYFHSRERKFEGTKVPWNESSRERKFHPWNFRSRERKYVGMKVPVTCLCDTLEKLIENRHHAGIGRLFTATCFSNVAVMGSLDVRLSVCDVGGL